LKQILSMSNCGRFLSTSKLIRIGSGCLVAGGLAIGCSKKKEEQFPATPPSAMPSTPAAVTANAPGAGPAANQSPTVDGQKAYADAEAAMKARDYQKAVEAALALQQQKQLTDAQAAAARNQMVRLQQQVAVGVASGDPKAKAAADRLRAAAAHY
jgi:hypothetical protein